MLAELLAAPTWNNLAREVQARALRLKASLSLQRGDQAVAEQLIGEADQLLPAEPRLAASVTALREGPNAAIALLEGATSRDSRQQRVSLMIDAQRLEEAAAEIAVLTAEAPDDAETQRLLAWLRLL